MISQTEVELYVRIKPYYEFVEYISSSPGITKLSAAIILAEVGVDMNIFDDAKHLCSWCGLSPSNNESAGKKKSVRIAKAGASYAIVVMLTASIVTGLAAGMSFEGALKTLVSGSSKMYWMFFMFVLFDPFLNYVAKSGAFDAIAGYMQPLIDAGGEVAFIMLSSLIGVFGISGAGVAQAQIIHELFLPMVTKLNISMSMWTLVVLVGCQITFFVTPTVDMVGQMGLARSKDLKAMLKNGWIITIITFIYVFIRAVLYARG